METGEHIPRDRASVWYIANWTQVGILVWVVFWGVATIILANTS